MCIFHNSHVSQIHKKKYHVLCVLCRSCVTFSPLKQGVHSSPQLFPHGCILSILWPYLCTLTSTSSSLYWYMLWVVACIVTPVGVCSWKSKLSSAFCENLPRRTPDGTNSPSSSDCMLICFALYCYIPTIRSWVTSKNFFLWFHPSIFSPSSASELVMIQAMWL